MTVHVGGKRKHGKKKTWPVQDGHKPDWPLTPSLEMYTVKLQTTRNKVRIAVVGAVPPLVELLNIQSGNLRELATAAILTIY